MFKVLSGMTLGFTGSYIFSQTIFTYRTGVHSRWVGIFIVVIFGYVVLSPVNILEVSPLFFLGSTLIFIGYVIFSWIRLDSVLKYHSSDVVAVTICCMNG